MTNMNPVGPSGTSWWLPAPAGSMAANGSTASDIPVVMSPNLQAALTDGDRAWLDGLLADTARGGLRLSELTDGAYQPGATADFVAVRTGAHVTPQYAGGYSVVGSVDGNGTNITYFATGAQPDAVKGVAISFGANTTPADRQAALATAQQYLLDHLSDAQDARGRWNRPTFDVRA